MFTADAPKGGSHTTEDHVQDMANHFAPVEKRRGEGQQ